MAEPADFDGSNTVLGKPREMSHEQCAALSVLRALNDEGNPVVISCWKVTQTELDEINRTGRIWLTVHGATMPPVCVSGEKPFEIVHEGAQ